VKSDRDATSIPSRALAAAERFADLEAIVDGQVRITYSQLGSEILRSTAAAIASGIEPGDRAAVWSPNSYRWIVAALGVLGAGGVLVPLNTRYKGREAADALMRARVRTLFTDNGFLDTHYSAMLRGWLAEAHRDLPHLAQVVVLGGIPDGDTSWDDYLGTGLQVADMTTRDRIGQVTGEDLSDVMFTSGTTGRPKGAMNRHGQILRLFDNWSDIVGLRQTDRYLVVSPFFHTFGYKAGWLAGIMRGATVIPMAVLDMVGLMETVQSEGITFLPGPPTLLSELLQFPDRDRYDLSSLRTTVTGAAHVPVELVKQLRSETSFDAIITGYGLTETNGPATICRADDDPDTIANTCGRAMPGTQLRIESPTGTKAPPGGEGEVLVRGANVMAGYLDDEDATAAAIDGGGWFHTGDIGQLDSDGNLRVTGRLKEMYIVGGFNAYPAEIEDVLVGHQRILQAAVVGVPDTRLGEVGLACIVPEADAVVTPEEVVTWARQRMANYKVPRYVEICDVLPRNEMGKVLKDELRVRWERRR
jgi:HIP---CoA ligase